MVKDSKIIPGVGANSVPGALALALGNWNKL